MRRQLLWQAAIVSRVNCPAHEPRRESSSTRRSGRRPVGRSACSHCIGPVTCGLTVASPELACRLSSKQAESQRTPAPCKPTQAYVPQALPV